MRIVDSILAELDQEAATTRRVLERVPDEKLDWRPHPKSMSLAQLAYHVATTPGGVASIIAAAEFEAPDFQNRPAVKAASELIPALDRSLAEAKAVLTGLDDGSGAFNLENDARRQRSFLDAANRRDPVDHAQSLVSPPGTALGLSPASRCARPLDLRTERG